MLVKTNVEGLMKDTKSGAILNVDNEKLQAYKKQKTFMEERKRDTERLNHIENDLSEIKNLLQALLKENDKC